MFSCRNKKKNQNFCIEKKHLIKSYGYTSIGDTVKIGFASLSKSRKLLPFTLGHFKKGISVQECKQESQKLSSLHEMVYTKCI